MPLLDIVRTEKGNPPTQAFVGKSSLDFCATKKNYDCPQVKDRREPDTRRAWRDTQAISRRGQRVGLFRADTRDD
jgi:hypothetical protein